MRRLRFAPVDIGDTSLFSRRRPTRRGSRRRARSGTPRTRPAVEGGDTCFLPCRAPAQSVNGHPDIGRFGPGVEPRAGPVRSRSVMGDTLGTGTKALDAAPVRGTWRMLHTPDDVLEL